MSKKNQPAKSQAPVPLQWCTVQRKLRDLIPYPNNPRILTESQAAELETSIDKFDLVEIPAINQDNMIIAGHQRIELMKRTSGEEHTIDVRYPNRSLTPEEVEEYNIRSNKNKGSWDMDMLANHYDENNLITWGFQPFELTGYIRNPKQRKKKTGQGHDYTLEFENIDEKNQFVKFLKWLIKRYPEDKTEGDRIAHFIRDTTNLTDHE